MIRTTSQILDLVVAKSHLVLDATTTTWPQLRQLAAAALTANVSITLKNARSIPTVQLVELAQLAPGLMHFDLST